MSSLAPTGAGLHAILPVRSSRLVLRRLSRRDLPWFIAYRNDPRVSRYQGWICITRPEAAKFIHVQSSQKTFAPGQWLQIAIALCRTNRLIGDCAVKIHDADTNQATIGMTLSRRFQRKGYATEAVSALLDCLFFKMRLHRVQADTDPDNEPAWRLMERLGMRREAHFRKSLWFKGRYVDEFHYAVLNSEWIKNRAFQD